MLVLVELGSRRVARQHDRVGGEVLRLGIHAELVRQVDQALNEREDVLRREDAHVVRHIHAEPLVELVAADLRQVVALRVEEERLEQVARVVERRRLTGTLLLEDLDQGLVLAGGRILLERVRDVDRVPEQLHDRLVRAGVELPARRRVLFGERAQERRDRELALPVDTRVDDALLVDLELEPRATRGHEVGREDLLGRVLRLHQVGAGAAHELRHDHALGAVDDERPPLGHHREVAHEDRLLADLARLLVDEADRHRERSLVGQVLLTALLDGELRRAEQVVGELDGERAGVVLDRRDVVDRLAEAVVQEPLERGLLDVDQVGEVEDVFDTGKRLARAGRSDLRGQRKSLPWGRARFRRLRACRTAGSTADGRNVGATCQDTDEAPLHASGACGGRAGNGTDGIVARRGRAVQPQVGGHPAGGAAKAGAAQVPETSRKFERSTSTWRWAKRSASVQTSRYTDAGLGDSAGRTCRSRRQEPPVRTSATTTFPVRAMRRVPWSSSVGKALARPESGGLTSVTVPT